MEIVDLSDRVEYRPDPPTVVGVPHPSRDLWAAPVRAFLVVGRMSTAHTLAYLFLGGHPTLERVEELVRSQPHAFPGDAVVVDLGESFSSQAEAKRRADEIRANLQRGCAYIVADLDEAQPMRA